MKHYFLVLIPVQKATGAPRYLTTYLINILNDNGISYEKNFVGFASYGANAMMGAHMVSRLKEAIPIIFIMKCICHSFHLCASFECENLTQEVENVTRDVYNYFINNPKRTGEHFQEYAHVSPVKILHPATTKWLWLEAVVRSFLAQYNALNFIFHWAIISNYSTSYLHTKSSPTTSN